MCMRAILSLFLLCAFVQSFAQKITLDGREITFDAHPRMVNGILMVPARQLFDAMNVGMRYRAADGVIEGVKAGTKIQVTIGSRSAKRNDRSVSLDEAPFIWKGRTYLPLKFVAESFRFSVSQEGEGFSLSSPPK
jgi:hypothetical protein